ncbi:MAG: DUF952 domain-containing protein [Pseudomonadota bacterium]|nr:DUF952 domain-containing protein [Pseudomonadota bacterium]
MAELIYHICRKVEWLKAKKIGVYTGSADDKRDGFIHFSTANQVLGSAEKHWANVEGLVLLSVDPVVLGEKIKWEPSRDNEMFPHLYGELDIKAVSDAFDLIIGYNGKHEFPDHLLI